MFFLRTLQIPPVLDRQGKLERILVLFIFLYFRGFPYRRVKRGVGMDSPSMPTLAKNKDKGNCVSFLVVGK